MNTTIPFCLAVTLAACGSSIERSPTVGTRPVGAESTAAVTPCPIGDALQQAARAAWKKGPGATTVECVAALAGGETLWLFDGSFEPEPNPDLTLGMWTALVTPAGEVRWVEGGDDFPYGAVDRTYAAEYQAVDLDGDGNDEIVYVVGYSHGGHDSSQLMVLRITGSGVEIVTGEEVALSSDNSAADVDSAKVGTCDGRHAIADAGGGRKHIEITYAGDCERVGTVTWTYDGTALRQAK